MTTMAIEDEKSISTDCAVLCVLLKDILKPIQADLVGSSSVLVDQSGGMRLYQLFLCCSRCLELTLLVYLDSKANSHLFIIGAHR